MNVFNDIEKALSQLSDPKFQKVLWRSIFIAIVLLLFPLLGITGFLNWILPDTITLPWLGELSIHGGLLSAASIITIFALSFLMFPVATLIIGLFLEEISDAVEARYYPNLPVVKRLKLIPVMIDAFQFIGIMVLANIIALLAYVIVPVFALFIFWALNGYLMGREYFQLVAARRIGMKEARRLRKKYFSQIWVAGILVAIPLSIPVVNIIVPILGIAVFTHQFHRLNDQISTAN